MVNKSRELLAYAKMTDDLLMLLENLELNSEKPGTTHIELEYIIERLEEILNGRVICRNCRTELFLKKLDNKTMIEQGLNFSGSDDDLIIICPECTHNIVITK